MKIHKLLTITTLSVLIFACKENVKDIKNNLSINLQTKNEHIAQGDTINLSINNPKNYTINKVVYKLNGKTIPAKYPIINHKLGKQNLEAMVLVNGETINLSEQITILNNKAPKVYTYNIVNTYPHDITSYTQGLEFYNGELYESTGQRGESKLRKVDYKTGKVLKNINLAPSYFGEGLTILNDKIYQLTWTSGIGFVYNSDSFNKLSSFKYNNSKQGWGLCNNQKELFKSDGTEKIWTLNPETLIEETYIQAYHNNGKVVELNELEWINGKIFANRYQKNGVAIINPNTGAIEGVIDFSALKNKVTQHPKLDVLNGIAYNPSTKTIFVTGKRWDKLFEVEIITE